MSDKKFVCIFGLSLLGILALISVLNFFVDPGNFYYRKMLLNNEKDKIAKVFSMSNCGVVWNGDERILSSVFATKVPTKSCVVIGSSHAMGISSERGTFVKEICESLMNLGVSGGGFEDFLIFIQQLSESKRIPKKILVEISPWFFKWDMDSRYKVNMSSLNKMKAKYGLVSDSSITEAKVLLTNLINLEYTKHSIINVKKNGLSLSVDGTVHAYKDCRSVLNPSNNVKLHDGSHVYNRGYSKQKKTGQSYIKKPSYKLYGNMFSDDVIALFKKVIQDLQKMTTIQFVLTPYHHNAYLERFQREVSYLNTVEEKVLNIAKDLNVKVFGSYDPKNTSCSPDDFFDYMHARPVCIDSLFR